MTLICCFAGRNVEICSLYPDIRELCRDYLTEGVPDFAVSVTPADLEAEREKAAREAALEGRKPYPHPEGYLETLAVYRRIAERMPEYGTVLFHGSCVAVDGAAYLFAARSGTGKSTHTRLWRELLKDRAVMVNDDKPLIHIDPQGKALVYGTPWDGKHRLSANTSAPLRAICLLERAGENRIREITRREALPGLIQQTYRPADPAALEKTLSLLHRLDVRFYRLACNMDPEAAELSYNTMKG